jgi:hypothetical protein
MTNDDAPILCMSRTIGSWLIAFRALTVQEFVQERGLSEQLTASDVASLIAGAAVHDYDGETTLTYATLRSSAVERQWWELHESALADADHP